MNRAMRTAATGMTAQQILVDTIANNVANSNTTGFKSNRLNFRSLLYQTMREPGITTSGTQMNPSGLQVGSGTEVASSIKSFQQGDIEATGGEYDVAINGEGFFRLRSANGDVRYTRDGNLRRDGNGDLVTVDGLKLEPGINIPADTVGISVGLDGQVFSNKADGTTQSVGQITLSRFANPTGLKAVGDNLYAETASSGAASEVTPTQAGAGEIRHKFRERSNVIVVKELIELIQAQRNYEINSRTIQVSDDMMQQVSGLIR